MPLKSLALLLGGALLLYLLLVLAVALLQQRLLYLPDRVPLASMVVAPLRPWPDGGAMRGLVAEPRARARATVVVFHGNAGHAGHRAWYASLLTAHGLRVVLAEYPGYGPRDGALGEASLVADALATLALARERHGGPLLVIGESLGAGVAAAASGRAPPGTVDGLLLATPWLRLADVAAHHYPWLPVRTLLADRYDSAANLAHFDRPLLVVVAERDAVVPAAGGQALHATLAGPRTRLVSLAGAGHNDWPAQLDAAWWDEALAFLLAAPWVPT